MGPTFAIRFSSASGASFSNVVTSLSKLHTVDRLPFVVCIIRPAGIELLLANSTFIRRVSHSSHRLDVDNVRGSFLGHDISRFFEGIRNSPENFECLFAIHSQLTWEENVERIVANTRHIKAIGTAFEISESHESKILASADTAKGLSDHPQYQRIETELMEIVHSRRREILKASQIDNINQRGNKIEQLITGAANRHELGDLSFSLDIGTNVIVDVKTKILTLSSNPKGYNIDKLLLALATGNNTFSFFFVGIDPNKELLLGRLVSFLDVRIVEATQIQFHWAGRNSRGVTQLTKNITTVFDEDFCETIDVTKAREFLMGLIKAGH